MRLPMPDKPSTWAAVLAWVYEHFPLLSAVVLSMLIGALRILHGGGSRTKAILEACLCALFAAGAFPLLEYFELPQTLATALGAFIGALGVKKIVGFADRFADLKLPPSGTDK